MPETAYRHLPYESPAMKHHLLCSALLAALALPATATATSAEPLAANPQREFNEMALLLAEPGISAVVPLSATTPTSDAALVYIDDHALAQPGAPGKMHDVLAQGRPVLLSLQTTGKHNTTLLRTFGISPDAAYTLLHKDNQGRGQLQFYNFEDDHLKQIAPSIAAVLEQIKSTPPSTTRAMEESTLAPTVTRHVNYVNFDGRISAIGSITVIRSALPHKDAYFIALHSRATSAPMPAGTNYFSGGEYTAGAYLPMAYGVKHALISGSPSHHTPVLLDYLPLSDSRTEFTYNETKTKGYTIGGSLGAEFGGGTPKEKLEWAAKSSFSLNASYTHQTSQSLTHSFLDYSLQAIPGIAQNGVATMGWRAPLASRFNKHHLLGTTFFPDFKPENVTPMMRVANIDTYSHWEIPAPSTSVLEVVFSNSQEIHRDQWRLYFNLEESDYNLDSGISYAIDLNSPYLAREMVVMIQSLDSKGLCLSDYSGLILQIPCDASQPNTWWRLDELGRYRNHHTNRCLSVNPAAPSSIMITKPCALDNNQYWEWRADRIHSKVNALWRIHTNGNSIATYVQPDNSMPFEDIPVNQFVRQNIPWTSYPNKPSASDTMPNHNGPSPIISPEWPSRFSAIDARQRWSLVILREGL